MADERPAPECVFLLDESIHGKAQLLAELQGWQAYLEEIIKKLGLWSTPSKELCRRQSETLLELRGHVERLRLAEEKTGGCRTVADLSVDQIVKDITAGEEAEQIAPNDDGVEEDQQPGFQPPASPSMPVLRNDTAVAAAVGGRVTPFHMETFHLKSMVADMSGVPMAKLKMQAETEDEVFLLWEPEQPPPSPSLPASSKIRANFLSARLKGHDADHGGRVDYHFFSPPIDFDTEEESPLQPGRHTAAVGASLQPSANVISINVTNSGSGVASFPLSLHGSIVVRDALDNEGICLFHRERDDPQLITSQDQPLLLTGPTCGLVVFGFLFFDFDHKLHTGHVEQDDVEFIRGMMEYNVHMNQHTHISDTLSSPLGAVELRYAAVRNAIECTVEIQILENSTKYGNEKNGLPVVVDRLVYKDLGTRTHNQDPGGGDGVIRQQGVWHGHHGRGRWRARALAPRRGGVGTGFFGDYG